MICRVVERPIDMSVLVNDVAGDDIGGVCTFIGFVRNHSRGQRVTHLEYHAYPEMSEKKMRQVIEEIAEQYGVDRIAVEHRIGTLQIGDIAVGIAASSAHRDAAFKACRYAIDRIKQIVPIWKKEFGDDGAVWVEECPVDAESA